MRTLPANPNTNAQKEPQPNTNTNAVEDTPKAKNERECERECSRGYPPLVGVVLVELAESSSSESTTLIPSSHINVAITFGPGLLEVRERGKIHDRHTHISTRTKSTCTW